MSRRIAEQSNALSIFWLKKHGVLEKFSFSIINWTHGFSGDKDSMAISLHHYRVGVSQEKVYLMFNYTITDRSTGQKEEMNYPVDLTTTPCNYGGVRYWFICPLTKNGRYCGRRVGVLYLIGKYFGCRYCGDIAYQAQFQGGNFRIGSFSDQCVEEAYNEVKREYYNGKPTRKYRRYLRMRHAMNMSWIRAGMKLGMKF